MNQIVEREFVDFAPDKGVPVAPERDDQMGMCVPFKAGVSARCQLEVPRFKTRIPYRLLGLF